MNLWILLKPVNNGG